MPLHGSTFSISGVSAPACDIDDAPLEDFIRRLSQLPVEEWQKRVSALEALVGSIPDYSNTSTTHAPAPAISSKGNGEGMSLAHRSPARGGDAPPAIVPWYRSSKSVRRLAPPLRSLLLDARSAVVKEATEHLGTLLMVKFQPYPSCTSNTTASATTTTTVKGDDGGDGGGNDDDGKDNGDADDNLDGVATALSPGMEGAPPQDDRAGVGTLDTTPSKSIGGAEDALPHPRHSHPPPPPFVARLLFKDLLVPLLQLSAQTVRVIRAYATKLTLDVLPHCRVKSALVVLLERMKADKNRSVREDCARYLRCIMETWPSDSGMNGGVDHGGSVSNAERRTFDSDPNDIAAAVMTSRKEERLDRDAARHVGKGLGRALSDPAQPVRAEAKKGFQVLFRRFRPAWDEVMNTGVVRDARMKKNLLEAASRSDNGVLKMSSEENKDGMSLDGSLISVSDTRCSYASLRSEVSHNTFSSRGVTRGSKRDVPSIIGTPNGSTVGGKTRLPRRSPNNTYASPLSRKAASCFSVDEYITTSGTVVSTPVSDPGRSRNRRISRASPTSSSGGGGGGGTAIKPFGSAIMSTPQYRPATGAAIGGGGERRREIHPPHTKPTHGSVGRADPSSGAELTSLSPAEVWIRMETPQRRCAGASSLDDQVNGTVARGRKSSVILRKRLSRRISLVSEVLPLDVEDGEDQHLTSICEKTEDPPSPYQDGERLLTDDREDDAPISEISAVALEVIAVHKSHLASAEEAVRAEKKLLSELYLKLGASTNEEIGTRQCTVALARLTEDQVCDYFESVHVNVDAQLALGESMLKDLEQISLGDTMLTPIPGDRSCVNDCVASSDKSGSLPQSPVVNGRVINEGGSDGLDAVQCDLESSFVSPEKSDHCNSDTKPSISESS